MGKRLIGSVGLAIAGGTPSPYTRTTSFVIACSDETTALTTGTKVTFRLPYDYTITEVRASLTTAGTGAETEISAMVTYLKEGMKFCMWHPNHQFLNF